MDRSIYRSGEMDAERDKEREREGNKRERATEKRRRGRETHRDTVERQRERIQGVYIYVYIKTGLSSEFGTFVNLPTLWQAPALQLSRSQRTLGGASAAEVCSSGGTGLGICVCSVALDDTAMLPPPPALPSLVRAALDGA